MYKAFPTPHITLKGEAWHPEKDLTSTEQLDFSPEAPDQSAHSALWFHTVTGSQYQTKASKRPEFTFIQCSIELSGWYINKK